MVTSVTVEFFLSIVTILPLTRRRSREPAQAVVGDCAAALPADRMMSRANVSRFIGVWQA
jgi:hypothetical protein